jgi:hypothetical protein
VTGTEEDKGKIVEKTKQVKRTRRNLQTRELEEVSVNVTEPEVIISVGDGSNGTYADPNGGSIAFEFTEPVTITAIVLHGYVHVNDVTVTFYDENGNIKGQLHNPTDPVGTKEDGVWTVSDLSVDNVFEIQFVSTTSGSIASFDYEVPEESMEPSVEPSLSPTVTP